MAKYLDFTGLEYFAGKIQTALNGKATSSHTHAAGDITSGTLPIARGGTGLTASPSMLVNLASTTADTVLEASPRPGVTGTLPIANGGTGATTAAAALTALGAAASSHSHSDYMTKADPTGTGSLSMNRKASTTTGTNSTTLGTNCSATGNRSVAIGYLTESSANCSFAGGYESLATAMKAFAFGDACEANGEASCAIGYGAIANGKASFAGGTGTIALDHQHAQGHYNNTTNATAGVASGTGTGTAFVIGNGTTSATSNAFRVDYNGKPYAKSAMTTTGADYAEYFEWLDSNPEAEDRRGYFVTLDGEKIKKAEPGDYILGIVSGQPAIIGNGDESWMGRYIMDDFGAFIYEPFEYEEEVIDDETGEVTIVKKTGTKYKENPDYDPTKGYIQREDRPEWSAVGMLGALSVRDDGTCEVNGYCKVAEGGTATKAETGYRVIKRVNDNIVKVIFR